MKKLRMLDLYSGILGFSLAAQWTNEIKTIAFYETDSFCRKVIKYYFPGVSERISKLRAIGNSIVPQVAYWIFKTILEVEKANENQQD